MMPYVTTGLSTVMHEGRAYAEGQEIPGLSPEQAAPLLALGVIQETAPPVKPPAK